MGRHRAAWRLVGMLGGVLASAALGSPTAAWGQTRFAWPDTAVDVATYTMIEQCQAAATRVRYLLRVNERLTSGLWRDTLPPAVNEVDRPYPAVLGATVRRCLARFTDLEAIPPTRFPTVLALYLLAGWDAEAEALVERRLKAIAADAEAERARVLDVVLTTYLGSGALPVRPRRLAQAQAFAVAQVPQLASRARQFLLYMRLLLAADSLTPPALDPRIAERALAIGASLTPAERAELARMSGLDGGGGGGESLERRFYGLLNLLHGKRTFLDALRRSTAAYVQLRRENWAQVVGQPVEAAATSLPIGQQAPALVGDLWLGRPDSSTPRPTPGRVSLVVFLTHADCVGSIGVPVDPSGNCAERVTALRRLEERFPALETTVVAQTRGHFLYLKDSLPPAREAELTKRWLESFGVRATLVMETTDAWRLPAPDGRRIDQDVSNTIRYRFGETWWVSSQRAGTFLIDRDGTIVYYAELGRGSQNEFAELIEILLERQVARP